MKEYLTVNEQYRYDVIKDLVNDRISKARACAKLNLSARQVQRLVCRYQTQGRRGFRHGNAGRQPTTTIAASVKERIIELYQTKYEGFNLTHFREKLLAFEGIGVSYTTLRTLFRDHLIMTPRTSRKVKRQVQKEREKQKKTPLSTSSRAEDTCNSIPLIPAERAHPTRERKKYFGELFQMDASEHRWFGDQKYHLHAAIDDATGQVVGAYFDRQETLRGYYQVTEQFIQQYGIPVRILTDNRTIFAYKKSQDPNLDGGVLTQYGYACQTLGIALDTTSIPQAKGRIERLFNTFQDRLINEMRLENITCVEQANAFLMAYLPTYNHQFALSIKDSINACVDLDSSQNLDYILAIFNERVIDHGHAIKYKNKTYRLLDQNGQQAYLPHRTRVQIIETYQQELFANHANQLYRLEAIPPHERYSKELDQVPERKQRKPYIPPLTHPWRIQNYYLFRKKQTVLRE